MCDLRKSIQPRLDLSNLTLYCSRFSGLYNPQYYSDTLLLILSGDLICRSLDIKIIYHESLYIVPEYPIN
jgi:hypothetical protein